MPYLPVNHSFVNAYFSSSEHRPFDRLNWMKSARQWKSFPSACAAIRYTRPLHVCILHVLQHWIQTVAFETAQFWVIYGRQFHFTEFIRNSVVAGVLFLSNILCLLLAGNSRPCYIESTFCGRASLHCTLGRFFEGVSGWTRVTRVTQERAESGVIRWAGYHHGIFDASFEGKRRKKKRLAAMPKSSNENWIKQKI